jgi:membrane protease YdiL (CAAX protease family)
MAQPRRSLAARIIQFPLTRVVLALVFVLVPAALVQTLYGALAPANPFFQGPFGSLLMAVEASLVALAAYAVYVRVIERRPVSELALSALPRETMAGILIGAGLFTAAVAVLALLDAYRILGVNPWQVAVPVLTLSVAAGVIEEIIFRGIVFRIVEEVFGSWLALVISALLFGFVHALNPDATLYSSVAIALEAGLLFGAAFMLTRRLWIVMGMHFAWNFVQGGVFGVHISGIPVEGIFRPLLVGPDWLTGGAFGLEASVVALAINLVAFAVVVFRAPRLPPFWARRAQPAHTATV